ncbi:response regulator [Sulfitobacter sp. HNIBRBA3233]|uniref:response regulator n=1 Tax=Sulfitobacter marinivivus TaxID=3158558 RepID=UPI0032DF87BE
MARILIADDDPDYISAFSAGMHALGHSVVGLGHSREVLPSLADDRFDVVFLDVLMPGGGAITLLHRVREAFPELSIVVLTGSASVFDSPIMKTGMRQADARISKTARLGEIADLIETLA